MSGYTYFLVELHVAVPCEDAREAQPDMTEGEVYDWLGEICVKAVKAELEDQGFPTGGVRHNNARE